ncbi:MAG TPA: T9SS type A sorting domain-containing protein [Flavipsychrobacter sp.]|nr:T9SS type A sorting domain-containing protein [Flavipsychrobacter sp.]
MYKVITVSLFCLLYYISSFSQILYKAINHYPGANYQTCSDLIVFKDKLFYMTFSSTNPNSREIASFDKSGIWTKFPHSSYFNGYGRPAIVGDTLYFSGSNGSDYELYKFDGVNPISLASDILPGPVSSEPKNIISLSGRLFFEAYKPPTGRELYEYNPVTGIARLIADTRTGSSDGYARGLVVYNSCLFYVARDNDDKYQIYRYEPSTGIVLKCTNNTGIYSPGNLSVLNGKLYFIYFDNVLVGNNGYQFYTIDSNNIVKKVTSINYSFIGPPGISAKARYGGDSHGYGILNNNLYFVLSDGNLGQDLYGYNLTTDVLYKVYHMNNLPTGYPLNSGYSFIEYKGKLYFNGDDSTHGIEFWEFDGSAPPKLISDSNPGLGNFNPYCMINYDDKIFFSAQQTTGVFELHVFGDTTKSVVVSNSINKNANVKVYPVPILNNVTIEFESHSVTDCKISIVDNVGKIVHASEHRLPQTANMIVVPLNELPSGTYSIIITDKQGQLIANKMLMKY